MPNLQLDECSKPLIKIGSSLSENLYVFSVGYSNIACCNSSDSYREIPDEEPTPEANLGCATTQELLEEIKARLSVEELNYREIGEHK